MKVRQIKKRFFRTQFFTKPYSVGNWSSGIDRMGLRYNDVRGHQKVRRSPHGQMELRFVPKDLVSTIEDDGFEETFAEMHARHRSIEKADLRSTYKKVRDMRKKNLHLKKMSFKSAVRLVEEMEYKQRNNISFQFPWFKKNHPLNFGNTNWDPKIVQFASTTRGTVKEQPSAV